MLEIEISHNNTYCFQIENTTSEFQEFIRSEVSRYCGDDEILKLKQDAQPFLQGDSDDWIFVEFWTDDYDKIQKWIDYLNHQLSEKKIRIKK
jgi:hypothetical protein